MTNPSILEELFETIEARKGSDASASYTASLFAKGLPKIAEKLGEEAIETVVAAMGRDKDAIAAESADLLYHLLVVWAETGVEPNNVWEILEARQVKSGHAEKAARAETGKNSVA